MCGIAGILNLTEGPAPEETVVRRMLGTIRHRGPDQFGMYLAPEVALGNARLSIVDLAGGQQPISNEDGRYWVVFNGEIFNHPELRQDLEARGHRFATHCDTEVIVHLYEDEGQACLQRLNGQFAIALWDEQEQSLFLARDRVGVRPLFYTRANGRLGFASEIKALLAVPGVQAEPDPASLAEVFTYWSPLSPHTCFRGIHEVPPGHYLLAKGGEVSVCPYWQPMFDGACQGVDQPIGPYVEQLRELLLDATRIRLRADVPVGAYLSGGLDSSLIASFVRDLGVTRLDTFSISFSDPRFDESTYQRQMAEALGTDHQVVYATHADIGDVFPDVVWHTETPLVRTAPAPMFLLSKLVRDRRYKVVLTGEGADEFLAGYDIFKEAKIRRFWARQPTSKFRPLLFRRLYPEIPVLATTGAAYLSAFFGAGLEDVGHLHYSHALRWRTSGRNVRFLSAGVRQAAATASARDGRVPVVPPESAAWDGLQLAQYLEIATFLSPYLLSSQGDRPAMAHSVEGRFPFLDVRVMEFCNRLPSALKLRGLNEKYLLRQVGRRSLPAEIGERRKRPYRAPIQGCFMGDGAPEYVADVLAPDCVRRAGLLDPVAVTRLLAKARQDRPLGEADEMALVGAISTQLWHRAFIAGRRTPAGLSDTDDVKVVRRVVQHGGAVRGR
jgi:asparagine synthase (glutamine-hydrolysing)